MKIFCEHGHFLFEEESPGESGRFSSVYGLDLVSIKPMYTFEELADAEEFSLPGKDYLGLPATAMFEGLPAEVMRANGFVFDITIGRLVPVLTVVSVITLQESQLYYVSNALIQPGSLLASGQRIVDYTGFFDWQSASFKYSEIGFL